MNSRWQQIIKYLLSATDLLTSSQLAKMLQVSSRTVRNDINGLNELLNKNSSAQIKSFRGRGYQLKVMNEKLFKQFLQKHAERGTEVIPTEPQERIQYIIEKLLLQSSYLKIDDLTEELFVSRSTLQSDLMKVRDILQQYNLSLDQKPNYGIKVVGDEMQIRFCISEHIFNKKSSTLNKMDDWLEILPIHEMEMIRDIILSKIRKYKILVSDISLQNLITHIAIACKRIRDEKGVELYHKKLKEIGKNREYTVAKEVVEKIEDKLQVTFSVNEVAYLSIHLQGTKMVHESQEREAVNKLINEEIQNLTKNIISRIEENFSLNIYKDQELILGLALHLKPAINRYKYNMNLRNPMLSEIKAKYPLAFEAALVGAEVISDQMNITIEEDEIGYMALHIEVALEREKQNKDNLKRCLIVCASGQGTAKLLYYKLKDQFEDQLHIMGTTELYNLSNQSLHNLDFIVSTIPINKSLPVPVIQVSALLGDRDIFEIEKLIIDDIKNIDKYMGKAYLNMDFTTKEEVISFLGDELYESGLVNEDFTQSVLEREGYSPTSFGNLVAIPHPIEPQTKETFWTFVTLGNPITWGNKPVQVVCLLNISTGKNENLKSMYSTLTKLLNNHTILQRILECKTPNEFKSVLKKWL